MRGLFKMCMVLLVLSGNMYSQNWLWSKSQGIHTTNTLQGNVRIGSSGNLVSFLAEANASYLVYTNAEGIVIWKKYIPNLIITDIIVDANDHIYFSGNFSGSIEISDFKFGSLGGSDAIIGVFDKTGLLLKAHAFGTPSGESANSIALSGSNVFATGYFYNSFSVNAVALKGNGVHQNTFILKFDANLFATAGKETVSEGCNGIKLAIDKNNNMYVLGNSSYTMSIGTQSIYIADYGQYVAKLNSNLNLTWLKAINTHFMNGTYLPYIYFDAAANFILGQRLGGGGGSSHPLDIEKYAPDGTLLWNRVTQINTGNFVDTDQADNIWVAGSFTNFDGSVSLSIARISTGGIYTQMMYDPNIDHRLLGLAVKGNNDFYIDYTCNSASTLNGYACSPNGSVFMARYGIATGIRDITHTNRVFDVYPNPANGSFIVACSLKDGENSCTLSVKNALGQVVYLNNLKDISGTLIKEVDLSSQPKGMYLVELASGKDKEAMKIIIQ